MISDTYTNSPPSLGRREVIALFTEIGRCLGLSSSATFVLGRIIGHTDNKAWTDPQGQPVFYGRQQKLAHRVGICARQLRNHERAFGRLGLIERRTLANGGRAGGTGTGLSLAPLKARIAEFMAIREEAHAEDEAMKVLAVLRSTRKRELAERLADLSDNDRGHPDIAQIEARARAWPRADALISMGQERLKAHVNETTALCDELARWVSNRQKTSGQPEQNFRPITEEIQDASSVLPKPRIETTKNANQTLTQKEASCSYRGRAGNEKATPTAAYSQPPGLTLDLRDMISIGSVAFQFEVGARSTNSGMDHAFVDAAAARIVPLGISVSAWEEACSIMGRARAATSVMIVDANCDHPKYPTRNPGGTLRSFTRAFESGYLNLSASLTALWKRRGREGMTA